MARAPSGPGALAIYEGPVEDSSPSGTTPFPPTRVGSANNTHDQSRHSKFYPEREEIGGEKAQIRTACSLPTAEFDCSVFQFYRDWVKDGKTKEATRTCMLYHLQNNGPAARLHPLTMYVLEDMVYDIKSLNFGCSRDLAYADCHHGLTPCMCPAVPATKKRKEMDKLKKRHTRATLVSPEDTRLSETGPRELPVGIYGLLQQLGQYSAILQVLMGDSCRHKLEVHQITELLLENADQFMDLTQQQVPFLVWDIHRDAHHFFPRFAPVGVGDDLQPRSNWQWQVA